MSTTAIILAQFKVAKAIYPHGLQVLLASTGSRTRLTDSHSTTSPNFKVQPGLESPRHQSESNQRQRAIRTKSKPPIAKVQAKLRPSSTHNGLYTAGVLSTTA